MDEDNKKVWWFCNSVEGKPYQSTTWYRCMGIEDFLKKVEDAGHIIVGMTVEDNNLGFILDK